MMLAPVLASIAASSMATSFSSRPVVSVSITMQLSMMYCAWSCVLKGAFFTVFVVFIVLPVVLLFAF